VHDYERYELGDLPLQRGQTLHGATLAFKTYGTLDAARANVIVFPTHYGGTHEDNEWLIGPGKALDTDRYFVVCPNLFGNGLSSSPSNTAGPQGRGGFPNVTVYDNVAAQHRLLRERFDVQKIVLAVGFSMGAQQAYHWAVRHPELVERIVPFCGSARTAPHNIVFLDSVKAALTADPAFAGGGYEAPPTTGLRTAGAVWAGWGRSQAFYREERWREQGYSSREDYVRETYLESFAERDANDMLAMLWTWQQADVSDDPRFGGDLSRALASVTARALVMPSATDLYFPPEDSMLEVRHLPHAELCPIPSVWGHGAGGNANSVDAAFVDRQIARWLAT
jgi:homoserine O-acetyltransferase/O-succinyltransferase